MAQLPISADDAEKEIKSQIAEKGLNVITSKMVRKHLEAKFHCHLDAFKNVIDDMIEACICEVNLKATTKQSADNNESDTSSSDFEAPSTISNANGGRKRKANEGAKSARAETVDESETDDLASAVKRRRSANQSMPKKRSQKTKDVDKKGGNRKRNSAFSKICVISAELFTLLGKRYMRRSDVVKEMWAYFRGNNLLDPKNKQFVLLDEPLKRVFGQKARIKAFGMMSELKKYVKDVALLDDAARKQAEADIAAILAQEEEEENSNELDKKEEEDKEELMTGNQSDDVAGNSGASSSNSDERRNDGAVRPLPPPQPQTANDNTTAHMQQQMRQEASADESSDDEGDTSDESSDEGDSDSD